MIPYVVLLIGFAYLTMRVQCWKDISTLGFRLNAPQGYLAHPGWYHASRAVVFIAALVAAVATGSPPIGKALVVLAGAWAVFTWVGRNDAFDLFRQTHKDLLAYEDEVLRRDQQEYLAMLNGEDPAARRAELEEGASMSNSMLRQRLKLLRASGL